MTDYTPPKKIYEEVQDLLLRRIKEGYWKSGDRIDSVEQLAKDLTVSRSAVREAISGLRALGIVTVKQGEGTFVGHFEEDDFAKVVTKALLVDEQQIKELYEVRKILEVGAARLAAKNRTPENIATLYAILEKMALENEAQEIGERSDMAFHTAMVAASKNEVLIQFMTSFSQLMENVLLKTRQVLVLKENRAESLYNEHVAIVKAIEAQDEEGAYQAIFEHLTNVELSLEKYIDFN